MGHHGLRDFNMTNKTKQTNNLLLMNISVAFIVLPKMLIDYPINFSFQNHFKNLIKFSMRKIQNSKSKTSYTLLLKFSLPKKKETKDNF
jgi:hypothetical protein